jgi:RNA polymerase sigma factor (sigma-70 family)
VTPHPPQEIAAILRTAGGSRPDPRLDEVLAGFRREWTLLARLRYPSLGDDAEDVVQSALLKVVSPGKLATLADPALTRGWARSVFVNVVLDHLRDAQRERARRRWLGSPGTDPEEVLRERIPATLPGPEEAVRDRERLAIALEVATSLEIGRQRFIDGLSEQEIAARCGTTRDAVASQLKRLRHRVRQALGESR